MGNYLTSYSDIVKYTLIGDLGSTEISAPINWNEDEKEFKRSEDAHGVFINLSNNLQFYKGDELNDGGYSFIKETYDTYGINAKLLLIKSDKEDDKWVESYRGYLDFSTYSRQSNLIEIKFNESGLYEKLKARRSEDFELNRETTMDGDVIDALVTQTFENLGREILIISEFNVAKSKSDIKIPSGDNAVRKYVDYSQMDFNHSSGGDWEAIVIPMDMVAEQSGNVQTIYDYDIHENGSSYEDGTTAIMFYADADNNNTLKVDIEIELEVVSEYLYYGDGALRLDLVRYENGENYDFKEYINLATGSNEKGTVIKYSASDLPIEILTGESLCLACHSNAAVGHILVNVNKANVTIKDPTFYDDPNGNKAEFILPYEALDRTIEILTGEKNALKSKILGRTDTFEKWSEDGFASLIGLTTGFLVRKFDDKGFTTSFSDFIESYNTVAQIGYGIEKIGFKEQLRLEHISHFYQNEVTIKIDQPSNIKRTVASDYFYSSLEIGYEKPSGDNLYEEAMGLDEYNVKNTYTTTISRVENSFEKISKYRADSYGKEFARRKPKLSYPEEDTNYDSEVFLLDLERPTVDGGYFTERKWEKDFVLPDFFSIFATGIYSAGTATNLRLSPLNILLRWGFWIKCGLEKYKDTKIRFSSSDGNSDLKTQLRTDLYPNSKEYSESGDIDVSDLDKSLFIPEFIEFDYPVDSTLLRKINGTSLNSEGDTIMNYYGLVEFTNEDNLKEYGFLMELKPNGSGSWKLLKANKKEVRFNDTIGNIKKQINLSGESLNIEV